MLGQNPNDLTSAEKLNQSLEKISADIDNNFTLTDAEAIKEREEFESWYARFDNQKKLRLAWYDDNIAKYNQEMNDKINYIDNFYENVAKQELEILGENYHERNQYNEEIAKLNEKISQEKQQIYAETRHVILSLNKNKKQFMYAADQERISKSQDMEYQCRIRTIFLRQLKKDLYVRRNAMERGTKPYKHAIELPYEEITTLCLLKIPKRILELNAISYSVFKKDIEIASEIIAKEMNSANNNDDVAENRNPHFNFSEELRAMKYMPTQPRPAFISTGIMDTSLNGKLYKQQYGNKDRKAMGLVFTKSNDTVLSVQQPKKEIISKHEGKLLSQNNNVKNLIQRYENMRHSISNSRQ